jgi:hypothetical protein
MSIGLEKVVDIIIRRDIQPDEITEKDKSVIGRAVIGGVLLDPVGAVVGGMSGLGTKQEIKKGKKELYAFIVLKNGEDMIFKINTDQEIGLQNIIKDFKIYRRLGEIES